MTIAYPYYGDNEPTATPLEPVTNYAYTLSIQGDYSPLPTMMALFKSPEGAKQYAQETAPTPLHWVGRDGRETAMRVTEDMFIVERRPVHP